MQILQNSKRQTQTIMRLPANAAKPSFVTDTDLILTAMSATKMLLQTVVSSSLNAMQGCHCTPSWVQDSQQKLLGHKIAFSKF